MTKCPKCGHEGLIVNECGCDHKNLPTVRDIAAVFQGMHSLAHDIAGAARFGFDLWAQDMIGPDQIDLLVQKCNVLRTKAKILRSAIRSEEADKQSYNDLRAAGGIVNAP